MEMTVKTRKEISMLSPEVAGRLREYRWRRSFGLYECLMKDDDHGTKGADPAIIPYIERSTRTVVYYGNGFGGSYNHHNQITAFKGKLYYAWSNGARNEEDAGQRVLMAVSADGRAWSEPWTVLDVEAGSPWAHNCVALHTTRDALYCVIMTEETEHDETVTGMRRIRPESAFINVYRSTDARRWETAFSFETRVKWLFEAPRLTQEGRLLCVCSTKTEGPAILRWPGGDICQPPELIFVPEPEDAWFPYGESTWYQLDGTKENPGRILVFWRDEAASCRVYVNWSDDGGRTFSRPVLSDIPDSMARMYAGRLSDGRYFLVNNTNPNLLDRGALTLLLSDDGTVFSKVYMINDSPTVMRRKGLLKVNGHQYPCCRVEPDKLIVGYDHNKEDIVCEVIDTRGL